MRSCRFRKLLTLTTVLAVIVLPGMGRGGRASRRLHHHGPQPLAIWIDHEQIEQLVGKSLTSVLFVSNSEYDRHRTADDAGFVIETSHVLYNHVVI